jgi:hypothetical protein
MMRSSIEKVWEIQAAYLLSLSLCRFRKLRYIIETMKCKQCGEKLRRVHRTFVERFSYMAAYECRTCDRDEFVPRRFRYHFGPNCRCPLCGTYRVSKLKTPDKIDRHHGGFLNLLERIAGRGQMYHCRWCRLQFFDRRALSSDAKLRHPAPKQASEGIPKATGSAQ